MVCNYHYRKFWKLTSNDLLLFTGYYSVQRIGVEVESTATDFTPLAVIRIAFFREPVFLWTTGDMRTFRTTERSNKYTKLICKLCGWIQSILLTLSGKTLPCLSSMPEPILNPFMHLEFKHSFLTIPYECFLIPNRDNWLMRPLYWSFSQKYF